MKKSLKHWRMRCSLRWFERRQKSFSALNGRSIGRNRWFRIDWFNSFNWWLFFLSLCAIRAPVFKNKSNYSINHLKSLTSFITIDYKSFISWKDFLLYFQQCILHNFQAYFYLFSHPKNNCTANEEISHQNRTEGVTISHRFKRLKDLLHNFDWSESNINSWLYVVVSRCITCPSSIL